MIKKCFMSFVLFICFLIPIPASAQNNKSDQSISNNTDYVLSGDVLYKTDPCKKIRLYDKVAAIYYEQETLYYIRSEKDKWIAGFIKSDSGKVLEFEIPGSHDKLFKFAGFNEVFYILLCTADGTENKTSWQKRDLIRFNPDNNKFQIIEGVMDFILLDGKPVILKNNSLDYNGVIIPHLLTGNVKITNIIDSRIVFIADENATEVLDLLSGMSFYQYGEKQWPELSGDYNLILEFTDNITKSDNKSESGNTIYYEVLVDGVEENRTETGRGEISKIFHANLDPGKYHIIKAERWELDKTKGRYVRVNNISQPGELKIFIPENRIIKIKLEFDGSIYNINQSVILKEEGG